MSQEWREWEDLTGREKQTVGFILGWIAGTVIGLIFIVIFVMVAM